MSECEWVGGWVCNYTYESVAEEGGGLDGSVDVSLGCAGIGDAVERVLGKRGVLAEALVVGRGAPGGRYVIHGEAFLGACCGMRDGLSSAKGPQRGERGKGGDVLGMLWRGKRNAAWTAERDARAAARMVKERMVGRWSYMEAEDEDG